MKDTIKIGIILNDGDVSLWICRVIEKILDSEYAEIKVVIDHQEKIDSNKTKKSFFYNLHERLDELVFNSRIDYNKHVSVSEILAGITRISIDSDLCKNSSGNAFHEISKYDADIFLNFTSLSFSESVLNHARFGIWRYSIEDKTITKRISNGYWEMVKRIPALEVVLRTSNSTFGNDTAIYRSWIPANYNSIHLNQDHAYGLCSVIIPRLLKQLYQSGFDTLNKLAVKYKITDEEYSGSDFHPPSNRVAFKNMLTIVFRYIYNRLVYKNSWNWFLAFTFDKNPFNSAPESFQVLVPPKDRFWADPFAICRNGKIFIFIEEFLYRTNKGHITMLELDINGKLLHTEKILENHYHMSYPFLFEYNGNYYMIPETYENKTIQLYTCKEFPGKWNFVMNLMENIAAMDTTLFFHNNKWWLFTALNESYNFPDFVELFLFYSTDLFTTEWIPHPNNPIVTDVRNARPAGSIFLHENRIYRPSQDCSGRYGSAYNLNQIIELSETAYEEVLVSKTKADWEPDLKGTHTFNFHNNFIIIDAYRFCKRFII